MSPRASAAALAAMLAAAIALEPPGPALAQSQSPAISGLPPAGEAAHKAAGELLNQLRLAKDVATAHDLEERIWAAWMTSGNEEVDGLVRQSVELMQTGQFDDALATLDTVVRKLPGYAEGWNKRATLLYEMKEYDRSMADIAKVLELEPRHFGALSGIGLINIAKGDRKGAIEAYRKVLEVDPQNAGAQISLDLLTKASTGDPI